MEKLIRVKFKGVEITGTKDDLFMVLADMNYAYWSSGVFHDKENRPCTAKDAWKNLGEIQKLIEEVKNA